MGARGPRPGDPRAREAGRKGGKVTAEKGTEHYRAIGSKGGSATAAKYGTEFYAEIGRKGGQASPRA